MNFCPECGIKLSQANLALGKCNLDHPLPLDAPAKAIEVYSEKKVHEEARKLPTNDEEREHAYQCAFAKLSKFFEQQGYESYVSDFGTLMVGKGRFTMDIKLVENDGRTAYVTSGRNYNPGKAGTRDSKATVVTSRTVMQARRLLRITTTGSQSVPIFVELRKSIPDPEVHICKAVLFVLQEALHPGSALNNSLHDRTFLKDVPPEWLPKAGEHDALFGLPSAPGLLT